MSTRLEKLFSRTPGQRRWLFGSLLAGLIIVPLAVAGLFAGALATADQRIDTIPAIVVNNDEMVNLAQADGSTTPVLAGRQLVTELTGSGAEGESAAGFDWTISNSADAADALAAGDAYAVLTIPQDFSASVTSLSGSAPQQAELKIRTDDAHSYLAGSAAQSVGTAMTGAFGRAITEQYLTGFYQQLGTMGGSLTSAADGAAQVSSGVDGLATGLDSLAAGVASASTGASSAANGADSFASGVTSYTRGVDSLSAGLGQLSTGTAGLSQLSAGMAGYANGVQQSADGFRELAAQLMLNPTNAPYADALAATQGGLDSLAAHGAELSGQTSPAIAGVQDGIAQSAAGAAQLAGGSSALRSGADDLASGVSGIADGVAQLADGTAASAAGAHQVAGGAGSLATGLTSGAEQASALGDQDAAATAKVVSDPVALSTTRAHKIDSIGPVIGTIIVPLGLWIGALAIFLIMRPVSALALASTASTGRIVLRGLGRAFGIAAAQAVVIVGLLHGALGVSWTLLPATLSFALLLALAFTAVHHALTVAFGRVGIVVSLVLLALQLTAAGGLYPIEIVAKPFQQVSPFLPLTWAVEGMQAIVSGAGGTGVLASAAVLAVFAVLALLVSLGVVSRRRGARSFSFALSHS